MSVTNQIASLSDRAEAVAEGLLGYLEQLPEADWRDPSDCAGWTIANLVSHLILVEMLLSTSVERGLRGDSGPLPQGTSMAAWREWRDGEIVRLGGLPKAELIDRLRAGLGDMRRALDALAGASSTSALGWHPSAGPQPLSWFPGQWLVEIALHDWDLRVAGDPEATVNPTALPVLGAEMRGRMPRCFKADEAPGPDGVVQIELDGSASSSWLARLGRDGLELVDDGSARPAATIRTDPGSYALAQTARRPAAFFAERGRWRVEGDAALAGHLVAAFVGY